MASRTEICLEADEGCVCVLRIKLNGTAFYVKEDQVRPRVAIQRKIYLVSSEVTARNTT